MRPPSRLPSDGIKKRFNESMAFVISLRVSPRLDCIPTHLLLLMRFFFCNDTWVGGSGTNLESVGVPSWFIMLHHKRKKNEINGKAITRRGAAVLGGRVSPTCCLLPLRGDSWAASFLPSLFSSLWFSLLPSFPYCLLLSFIHRSSLLIGSFSAAQVCPRAYLK